MNEENQKFDPGWSYKINVEDIEAGKPVELEISPNESEKLALKERLSISSVNELSASLVIRRVQAGKTIHVKGTITANITQQCVVSMDPVISDINEEFEAWFAEDDAPVSINKAKQDLMIKRGQSELPILDEADDPEIITDGAIDLGDQVAQFLSLNINPYVHAEGVEYELGDEEQISAGEGKENPFAALKDWKNRHSTPKD